MFRTYDRVLALLLAGLLAVAPFAGCGKDEDTGVGLPVEQVAEGWTAFEGENYASGLSKFSAAAAEAPGWGEPYSGLGWCYAALGRDYAALDSLARADENLARADENFDAALSNNSSLVDAWAGAAIVNLVLAGRANQNDAPARYQQGGYAATRAINLGGDKYIFRYDAAVNNESLRIVLAECAFYLGDYATAEEQVETVDRALMINSSDPDYAGLLLEAIGRLSTQW